MNPVISLQSNVWEIRLICYYICLVKDISIGNEVEIVSKDEWIK